VLRGGRWVGDPPAGPVAVLVTPLDAAPAASKELFDLEVVSLDELRDPASGDQSIEPAGATHWLVNASTVARVSKWRS
jgi:hypothetical protein